MSEHTSSVLRAALGIGVFVGVCWLLSENRRKVSWRLVLAGLGLQFAFAFLVLKVSYAATVFDWAARFFVKVTDFSYAGAWFLFRDLVAKQETFGFIFAFHVLPTIIFFASLSSVLYYLGILQWVVHAFAWVMSKTMRLSGAESLSTAANIFLGQTEAPLMVRPYLAGMTRSEMLCVMLGGMATIAGGVLAAFVGFLGGSDEALKIFYARHLLAASILAAPATIVISKLLVPETQEVDQRLQIPRDKLGTNVIDAAIIGANDGLMLALNVAAALIAFIALVAMVNFGLEAIGQIQGLNDWIRSSTDGRYSGLSLHYLLGMALSPVAWLIGVAPGDVLNVGRLLGERTVINEFVAYESMGRLKEAGAFTDPRSVVLATYALCGFANFSSLGIQVGGISALAPSQRPLLASLALKSMWGGVIACLMTACVAAFFV